MKENAAANRLRFNKEERNRIRQLKSTLKSPTAGESCCAALRMEELDEAIRQMCNQGTRGPDDFPLTFLKAPGPRARQELLDIFNFSFSTGRSPQIWKIAIILPLKKAEKTSGCIPPYRPVSLRSCLAKPLERILHNRLYYLAETRDWLCTEQAGFRKSRSCEDQILSLTQSINDGY